VESASGGSSIQSGEVLLDTAAEMTHAEVDLLTLSREHGWREGQAKREGRGTREDEIKTAVNYMMTET
jgi:hypothetical protein